MLGEVVTFLGGCYWRDKQRQLGAKRVLLLLALLLSGSFGFTQIAVTQNANTQTLAQLLAGPGVTISNYTKNCDNNGTGTFANATANLGLNQGVVMASGRVQDIVSSANNFASTSFSNSNDPELSSLTSGAIYDKCIIEFDIVPQGTELSFNYVFASEEYPEFVCSPYNDVFGFFISGPNPGGGNYANKNIAIIPNSTMPVCINSVNPGISGTYKGTTWNSSNCQSLTNTSYFINNLSPLNTKVVYDGMTTVLQASAKVIPCQTYHLKLAIADVGDRIYDSGVFLEAYSFTSSAVSVSASAQLNYAGFTSAYEGCVGGTFTVSLSAPKSVSDTIPLQISGSATNGVDYVSIPPYVVIPAGQLSATIPLIPLQDSVVEPEEEVTIAVFNPCTGSLVSSATLTIQDKFPLSLSVSDSTLCMGQSAQLSATGGLSYHWHPQSGLNDTVVFNPIITPTTTTNVSVDVSFGGCMQTLSQMIYVSHPDVQVAALPHEVICSGTEVSVQSLTANGVPPYRYLWSNGDTIPNLSLATAGNYSLTITDQYGCTADAATTLTASALNVALTPTDVACYGASTGALLVTATGGIAPLSFVWEDGTSGAVRNNIAAGNYRVIVSDSIGCTDTAFAIVRQPDSAIAASVFTNPVACYGAATGNAQVTANGGTYPYSFLWSTGDTGQIAANLIAGNYGVTVTDAHGCTATAQEIVAQPSAPLSLSSAKTDVACYGQNTGALQLTAGGGTAPYAFVWADGATVANRANLSAGVYAVTVTDAQSCTVASSYTLTQPQQPIALTLSATDVACHGDSSGALTLVAAHGVAPYMFVWSTGATNQNLIDLTSGNYGVTATDVSGCTATASAWIAQPASALSVAASPTAATCYAAANGAVQLTVSGGTVPYTYLWTDGRTDSVRQTLSAGNYGVTVTDAHGCSAVVSTVVAQPIAALSVSGAVNQVTCYGQSDASVALAVAGGTAPYSYQWSSGVNTDNLAGIAAGVYQVTVTDAQQCTATWTANVTQPSSPLLVNAFSVNANCNGALDGAIHLAVSGGTPSYSYAWNNGNSQQNLLHISAGNYTVTVRDANGCSALMSANVGEPSPLTIQSFQGDVSCYNGNDGFVFTIVSGGTLRYNYQWSTGSTAPDVTDLPQGNYSVTVTDAHACTAEANFLIEQPSHPLMVYANKTDVICNGAKTGALQITPTGGVLPYTYEWNNGLSAQNASTLPAGTYRVTVTDANYCTASVTAMLTEGQPINVRLNRTNVSCHGKSDGSITISASGGAGNYSYHWSNDGATQAGTNLPAGQYEVTVEDGNHCTAMAGVTVSEPAPLSANASIDSALCFGSSTGAIHTDVSGGTPAYRYLWSTGSVAKDIEQLPAGNYSLTVTDARSCTAVFHHSVQQADPIRVQETHTDLSCAGDASGTIALHTSGGAGNYQFAWSSGATTSSLANLSAGVYAVTVSDKNSCTVQKTVSLTEPAAIHLTETHHLPVCHGLSDGVITISASGGAGGYQYEWNTGANTPYLNDIGVGVYAVTVTDAHGCQSVISSIAVLQPDTLALTLTASDVRCAATATGAAYAVAAGGNSPYSYLWSNGAQQANLTNVVSGNYSLTVTDIDGCTAAAATVVADVPAMNSTAYADSVPCAAKKGSIVLHVQGGEMPYTYLWSNGKTTKDLTDVAPGVYSITVKDANDCVLDTSFAVVNTGSFTVKASGGGTVTLGESVPLQAVSGGSSETSFSWIPDQTVACPSCSVTQAQPARATVYWVTAVDTDGCTAMDSVSADVLEDYTTFTPNAFTPNGDGNNDYFEFYGNKAGLKLLHIAIFNRWGEKMFESDDPYFKWDGVYKGETVPPGVYVYVLKMVYIDGHADKIRKGSITVLR